MTREAPTNPGDHMPAILATLTPTQRRALYLALGAGGTALAYWLAKMGMTGHAQHILASTHFHN